MELNPYEPPREVCRAEIDPPVETDGSDQRPTGFEMFCTAVLICFGMFVIPLIALGVFALATALAVSR